MWTDRPVQRILTETLCVRILDRRQSTIRVQKDQVTVKKLAFIVEAALDLSNKQGFHTTTRTV